MIRDRKTGEMLRQLTDLTPRQLQRLKQLLAALKGLHKHQAREVLDLAAGLRGLR